MNDRTIRTVTRRLLRWYGEHARNLPWRHEPSPYQVWVSEIMLQQTTVPAVTQYYARWLERFPDVRTLAEATEREVLSLWEGMGYYQRARRLREAARLIVERHEGRVAASRDALEALPGIGPYVAGAILSLAFGRDEAAVDANVVRVFMRLLAVEGRGTERGVRDQIEPWVRRGLPTGRSAEYNQAWMDFGSLVCRPRRPLCGQCVLRRWCEGYSRGVQYDIPTPSPRRLRRLQTAVAVFLSDERVYLQRRAPDGLFGGMWEFPGGKVEEAETPRAALRRECREELGVDCTPGPKLARLVHYYTVFEVTLHAFRCAPPDDLPMDATHRWVPLCEVGDYPMPSASRRIMDGLSSGSG